MFYHDLLYVPKCSPNLGICSSESFFGFFLTSLTSCILLKSFFDFFRFLLSFWNVFISGPSSFFSLHNHFFLFFTHSFRAVYRVFSLHIVDHSFVLDVKSYCVLYRDLCYFVFKRPLLHFKSNFECPLQLLFIFKKLFSPFMLLLPAYRLWLFGAAVYQLIGSMLFWDQTSTSSF